MSFYQKSVEFAADYLKTNVLSDLVNCLKDNVLKVYEYKNDYLAEFKEYYFKQELIKDSEEISGVMQLISDNLALTLITDYKMFFPETRINFDYFNVYRMEEELESVRGKNKRKDYEFKIMKRRFIKNLYNEVRKKKLSKEELILEFPDKTPEEVVNSLYELESKGFVEEKENKFEKNKIYEFVLMKLGKIK